MTFSFWREPLVHFLAGGLLIYLAYAQLNPSPDMGRHIVVDRQALVNFAQYRAGMFRPDLADKQFDRISRADFDKLAQQYVDEEMLYREALAYGLEENDEVIRQRLVQKAQYLFQNSEADARPSDAALRDYHRRHAAKFREPPTLTLTHVFIEGDGVTAKARADAMLATLNRDHAAFSDAPRYGDRFPYLTNFVDRPLDFVASQMGPALVGEIGGLTPSTTQWRGPFRSPLGWHVILLTGKKDGRALPLEEVRTAVADAYREERRVNNERDTLRRLRARYRIDMNVSPPGVAGK